MSDNRKKGLFMVSTGLLSAVIALAITYLAARYYDKQLQSKADAFFNQADKLQKTMRRDAKLYP